MKKFLKQSTSQIHKKKLWEILLVLFSFFLIGCGAQGEEAGSPETIRLDYAHYSPTSLVYLYH